MGDTLVSGSLGKEGSASRRGRGQGGRAGKRGPLYATVPWGSPCWRSSGPAVGCPCPCHLLPSAGYISPPELHS